MATTSFPMILPPPMAGGAVSLAELFGPATPRGLSVGAIDAFITGRETASLAEAGSVTPADLIRAARALRDLEPAAHAGRELIRTSYLEALEVLAGDEEAHPILSHVRDALRLDGLPADSLLKKAYAGLSHEARNGLYLLLVDGGVAADDLAEFLLNPDLEHVSGGADRILRTVEMLYHLRVENYAAAFKPTRNDGKFFEDASRIRSLLAEYDLAVRIASRTDATRLQMDPHLDVDWNGLNVAEKAFLRDHVVRNLSPRLRRDFHNQVGANADLAVKCPRGVRLVELKTYHGGRYRPERQEEARILLQILRYGLAVRRYGLQGVEFVVQSERVCNAFLRKILSAFEATGVPYLVRHESAGSIRTWSKQLHCPEFPRDKPQRRLRPLPVLPGEAAAPAPETGAERIAATSSRPSPESLPWTREIRKFLEKSWPRDPGARVSFKRDHAENFIEAAQNALRQPQHAALVEGLQEAIDAWAHRGQRTSALAALEDFRHALGVQGNTPSREILARLVRLAALATGDRSSAPEDDAVLDRALAFAKGSMELGLGVTADVLESDLKSLEELTTEGNDPKDLLVELAALPIEGEYFQQWTLPEVLRSVRRLSGLKWNEPLIARLEAAIARRDALKVKLERAVYKPSIDQLFAGYRRLLRHRRGQGSS
ncbi:MAG TPA: hypothetical protein VFX30_01005 [bacterium]|nr:hypothetical protein [bacterium]